MSLKPAKQLILWFGLWVTLVLLSGPLMAEESAEVRSSKSISFSKTAELDKSEKDQQLQQADADIMAALSIQGFRPEATVMAADLFHTEHGNHGEATIYDASTELISDFDSDGFYHRFSVAIDADTVFDTSYIYAMLYLSYEGGPWNHYASSDDYHIHGDSELDTFIIETELADGFPPGYYDIRIELYDADTGHWLDSYGPYDDASLSALPLEDSYYDTMHEAEHYPVETEVVVAAHGGSMNWLILLLSPLIMLNRRIYATSCQAKAEVN